MPNVLALSSFEHNGKRKRNEVFNVSDNQAIALARAGLVMIVNEETANPIKATYTEVESSALEVAQVSPEQTLNKSDNGDIQKKRGRKPKQSS